MKNTMADMAGQRGKRRLAAACFPLVLLFPGPGAAIDLADAPLFSSVVVPGNLALALSVEWPTATTPAYTSSYSASSTFLGYFDPGKCYQYAYDATTPANSYFQPYGSASSHACTSSSKRPLWSGNYLNWAAMQTLDTFRWVLTGGYRSVDTAKTTVLTKTYAFVYNAKNPDKTLSSDISGATPLKWSKVKSRVRALGTSIFITKEGSLLPQDDSAAIDYVDQNSYVDSGNSSADSSKVYRLYINVKVCDSSVGLEDNCQAYGSNYKPEGLLQKYASKLRYSAFGYLNDSSSGPQRNGAVMRARMKYIGPTQPVPGSAAVANDTAKEWDASTGIMLTNPDSSDATATETFALAAGWSVTIPNSGVMNYLNKFGYASRSYKSYDPVSELYYAVNRYFRNLGNVPSYSSLSAAGSAAVAKQWLDAFPVIPRWDDPIAHRCQKNFILGIGDINAHRDANVPGSTLNSGSEEGSMPTEVSADTTVNAKTATDMVGTLEGNSTSLGTTWLNSTTRGNTYFIAGLAYDAHTKDIRSDLSGTQTINTYWLDVLENGYADKNQFWLAAKYGGFAVPSGFSPYSTDNNTTTLPQATWYTSNDTIADNTAYLRPDNYFPGDSPAIMKSGLIKAFEKIVAEAAAATSTTLASSGDRETASGNANYTVSYDPNNWTSTLKGQLLNYSSDGTPVLIDVWNATNLLDARTATNRLIVTCCTNGGAALPFTYASLRDSQLNSRTDFASFASISGVSDASQSRENYVNYLRGTRSLELANGGPYRNRTHLLGDIVNAKLTAIGVPNSTYYEIYNSGYRAFKASYASRPTVVYAAANDGMLHVFDGTVPASSAATCTSTLTTPDTTCGKELFAYIPSFAYAGSSDAATSGLASLGSPSSFSHHYLVDATPVSTDVDFFKTVSPTATAADWRTLLVGGLGKGGMGYYAIDVTDPSTWTTEAIVASKVLWEFTDSHMGYSFGDPVVVKTPEYGWTVILPSGYNNDNGHGYFFFLNPRTGEVLRTVDLGEGSKSAPLNMAHVEAYVPDVTNNTADTLYAGDLQGNVWRVDLTASSITKVTGETSTTSSSYDYTVLKLATLTDPSGVAQPVTTRPLIQADPSSGKRYVLLGSGRLLSDSDAASTQVQTFYAIIDGTAGYGKFYNSTAAMSTSHGNTTTTRSGIALPASISFPITRSVMVANTDLLSGIGSNPPSEKPMGWYFDLPVDTTSGIASRVNVRPDISNGIVAFAANLPNGDVCSPSGNATVYATGFADGASVLIGSNGNQVASLGMTSTVSDLTFKNVDGRTRLIGGNGDGSVVNLPGNYVGPTSYKRLNWREVPTAN